MTTLHIMVGLPCSGKTTYARRLAEEAGALLLTPDAWHLKLFGDDASDERHDGRHTAVEEIMLDVARRALALGTSVILDFGFWAREERDALRAMARDAGADFKMHYMDVSKEELWRRLERRNRDACDEVFVIPREMMETYIPLFQPPEPDELA